MNAYLGKRSYYHSSSTMHSCKLWHYLCWHRGETWRREKKMKGENKEKKVWHLGNTHTNFGLQSMKKIMLGLLQSGLSDLFPTWTLCPSPAPSISPLFGVSVWSEPWMEAGTYRTLSGGVCACVFGREEGGVSETGAVARAHGPVAFSTVWHPRVQWEHQPSVSHQQRWKALS